MLWADGGPRQRLLLVTLPRWDVRGLPPALLLPLLRRLGRLGVERAAGHPAPLRPEAADGPAGLGGTHGPLGGGARASRAHAGEELSETRLVEDTVRRMREEWRVLPARRLSRAAEGRRWPSSSTSTASRVADQAWQVLRDHVCRCLRNFYRLPLLAEIRRTPRERWILIEDSPRVRVRGHADLRGAGLRLLDAGRPARAGRLEDRQPRPRGDGDPAGRVRALRAGHPGSGPGPRGPPGGEPPGGRGHRAPVGRGATRRDPRAAPALDPGHEGLAPRRGCNVAALEDFERTEDLRLCRWCNFKAVCRPGAPGRGVGRRRRGAR